MLIRSRITLVAILVLAAVLRFNQLTTLPALNADEAAIGYNAYSLLETGRDEHGNSWPVHFESFGDFKPGLFFYLVLPFVKLLGLTELAVRLPGALLGVATVFVIYFLVLELFRDKKPATDNWKLATLASLVLAISPWHIHFSRGGWEVNVATFFITAASWLFLKGLKDKKWWFMAVAGFAATLYSYHAARVVVPLLGLGLVFIFRKQIFASFKTLVGPAVLGVVLLVPLIFQLLGPAGISRFAGVGLLADPGPLARINEQRGEHGDFTSAPAIFFHNKLVNYGLAFADNWARHFWGEFLFLSGDEIQRNRVPETGQLYLFDFVFIVIGLLAITRNANGWGPILWWLVVAPTAAALTFQSPHALRAHNMVIPLTIISAYGLVVSLEWLKKNLANRTLLVTCYLLLATFSGWNFTLYLHQYYVHMAKEYPFSSQYGVKELVSFAQQNYNKYPKIVLTDRYDQPYILFLFYLKYPPEKFQSAHALTLRDRFGFSTVRAFDKFEFRPIDFTSVRTQYPGALIAGTDEEIPQEANIIKEIYFPSGKPAFQVVAN